MQRHTEVIRETSERITIRYRKVSRTAYCSSCGKATTWIDAADDAKEIVALREKTHPVTELGPLNLLCTGSIISKKGEEEKNKE